MLQYFLCNFNSMIINHKIELEKKHHNDPFLAESKDVFKYPPKNIKVEKTKKVLVSFYSM